MYLLYLLISFIFHLFKFCLWVFEGIHSLFVYGQFIKINIILIFHFSLLKIWFTFSGMGELSFFYVYAIFYLSGFMMSMFFLLCFYLRWELFKVPSNSVQLSWALSSSSSLPIPYLHLFACYIVSLFPTPSLCSFNSISSLVPCFYTCCIVLLFFQSLILFFFHFIWNLQTGLMFCHCNLFQWQYSWWTYRNSFLLLQSWWGEIPSNNFK